MKPIYKWSGGKRKDIQHIEEYFPNYIKTKQEYTLIEPFYGGGAVYWYLENDDNIINDIDIELINFNNILKTRSTELSKMVDDMSFKIQVISDKEKNNELTISDAKTERGKFYYDWRNKDRKNGLETLTDLERAFRFYIVNQLSFNGMRRFNSKGEFNIPYGNYKLFNRQFHDEHIEHLKRTEIHCGSYKDIIKKKRNNTFVFIDPPYTREFKEYSHDNDFGEKQQVELSEVFKTSDCDIMIVINKDDFTTELYKDYIKKTYDFKYSTNIKNRYSNEVEHLIITNY